MAVYLVACVECHDQKAIEEYGPISRESMKAFGGKYLVRGAPYAHLEGEQAPKRLAIVEFPTPAKAKEWAESDAYAPAIKIRHDNATTHWIVILEGV